MLGTGWRLGGPEGPAFLPCWFASEGLQPSGHTRHMQRYTRRTRSAPRQGGRQGQFVPQTTERPDNKDRADNKDGGGQIRSTNSYL